MTNPQRAQLDALYAQGVLSTAEYDAAVARLVDPSAGLEPPPPAPLAPKAGRNRVSLIVAVAVVVIAAGIAIPITLSGHGSSKPKAQTTPTAVVTPSCGAACLASQSAAITPEPVIPSNTEPAPPAEYQVGESESLSSTDDSGDSATADLEITSVRAYTFDNSTDSSPDNGIFLAVKVTATGETGAYTFNPDDFYVSAANGDHFEDSTFSSEWGNPFSNVTVHSGENSRGTIVFDVSRAARKGGVYYSPNSDGNPLGYWDYTAK